MNLLTVCGSRANLKHGNKGCDFDLFEFIFFNYCFHSFFLITIVGCVGIVNV